ncbi:MAG TPA: HdeD family acid-resistance protein [Polyangia bacterium]|nr:HdeD family acid-resistance protein [Polyangia bacterium]
MLTTRDEVDLSSRWGWVILRGIVAILFGLLAFARPGAMTLGLIMLFAAYAFVGGIAAIIAAAQRSRAGTNWGMLMVDGILGVAAAIIAVLWPATAVVAFVWVLAAWAVATGAMEIAGAISLRKVIEHEWALGLAGLVTVAFGVLMFLRPAIGGLAVVWWLGAYAIVFGALMLALGFRLRGLSHGHTRGQLPTGGVPHYG